MVEDASNIRRWQVRDPYQPVQCRTRWSTRHRLQRWRHPLRDLRLYDASTAARALGQIPVSIMCGNEFGVRQNRDQLL